MTQKLISRTVESIVEGSAVSDGAGVKLKRVLSTNLQQRLDPFLMLDEFGSESPDDYLAGFPDHPHRGFETVTYMLEGRMRHRDNAGHEGLLGPGDVQWMTAGSGVVHSEMPEQEQGRMQGFQLWVNLAAKDKMTPPRYRGIAADQIPQVSLPQGVKVAVIAGELNGIVGAVRDIRTQPLYLDITLPAASTQDFSLPVGHNAFIYVYSGQLQAGPQQESTLQAGQLGVLGNAADANAIHLQSRSGARLLLIAGQPLGEPIVQWGPFVMNSRAEIEQAFADYRSGKF
jgi:redox-sensitive bicupin YhaK (pirin superfamily)